MEGKPLYERTYCMFCGSETTGDALSSPSGRLCQAHYEQELEAIIEAKRDHDAPYADGLDQ